MRKLDILNELNEGQREAVKHINGPALTTATAGAGKTKVIVTRTQYMILEGVSPSQILLTTFTNKAANEIKKRIVDVVGEQGKFVTVGTFHSICNKILRQYSDKIGYNRNFTILDDSDIQKLIKSICKKSMYTPDQVKGYISYCKYKCITANQAMRNSSNDMERELSNFYDRYQTELKRQMAMDFDDLLLNTVILLENYPDVLKTINNRWQYISADENQDSSDLDSRLLSLLAGNKKNLFMVGDDYQSIYGFRGANINVMLNLDKQYDNLKIYNLGINYRSTQTIIEAGKSIISHNKYQLKKAVECGRKDKDGNPVKGYPIIQTKCKDQKDEARKVVACIETLRKRNVPLNEIAILSRVTYLSRNIEEALMKAGIKYNLIGGVPFFCRMEIQDILSYARLTVNEYDFQAFRRTIAIPKRGIGEKTIDKIDEFCKDYPLGILPIRQALNSDELILKGKAKKSIEEYNTLLNTLDNKKMELSPREFIDYIIKQIDYITYLKENYKEDFEERIENLNELLNVCDEYDNIEDLLIQASLYREDIEEDNNAINIMTVHKSKGLEFEAVIMTNMCEGTFPHYKSLEDERELEEERRLAFVGVTRAKNYLFMTYPQKQKIQGVPQYVKPSRFLREIDPKLVYRN